MSYFAVPARTPHVPELDWSMTVTVTVAPNDVGTSSTEVYTKTGIEYSGFVIAVRRSSWSSQSSQSTVKIITGASEPQSVAYPEEPVFMPVSSGGSTGVFAPFSKGDYIYVAMSRPNTSASDSAYVYLIPYKGQTMPTPEVEE